MKRKLKEFTTAVEFEEKFKEIISNNLDSKNYDSDDDEIIQDFIKFSPEIKKDLERIIFDMENFEKSIESTTIGNNTTFFYEIFCGGDWENPIRYILYISDKLKIRAYLPKTSKNFNLFYGCAYGSERDTENFDDKTHWLLSEIKNKTEKEKQSFIIKTIFGILLDEEKLNVIDYTYAITSNDDIVDFIGYCSGSNPDIIDYLNDINLNSYYINRFDIVV